jgi:hypothetical protein
MSVAPSDQYEWQYTRALFVILVCTGYVAAALALYYMFNNATLHG